MARHWYVTRDGKQTSPAFDTFDAALRWIHTHTPFSFHHARQHEGYDIVEEG